MIIYFIIFLILAFLCFLPQNRLQTSYLLGSSLIILILFAGFRGDIDNDYDSYIKAFESFGRIDEYFVNYSYNSYFEPFYYILPSLYKELNYHNYVPLFIFFACLGVLFKYKAITSLSKQKALCLITYFSYLFLLHEMTQIRVGIASGILLWSLYYVESRRFIVFLLLILLACCFHYSSILFFPVYFLSAKTINKKFWIGIITIPIIVYFLNINFIDIVSILSLGILSDKLVIYQTMFEQGEFAEAVNVFNARIILQFLFTFFIFIKIDWLNRKNKYSILLLKCLIISLALFFLFSSLPVFAFRLQELYGVAQIISYPLIFFLVKEKYIGVFSIILLAFLTLAFNLYYLQLLKPYF